MYCAAANVREFCASGASLRALLNVASPESDTASQPSVAICISTYRRPRGLRALLESINGLRFETDAPRVVIKVADNDPEGGAQDVCETLRASVAYPIEYAVEPRRGISEARNRALDMVGEDVEFIALVDDDETVAPDWLERLLCGLKQHDADVVSGPVLPAYPEDTPGWVIRGGFFEQGRFRTGSVRPYAYTNNVLFRRTLLTEYGLRFDERYSLIGGGDRAFFQRAARAGCRIVWIDEACVREVVPASRAKAGWILRRGYRYGITSVIADVELQPGVAKRAQLAGIGVYRIIKGSFFLPLTWPLGRHHVVTYVRHICYGMGMLVGLCGGRYEEYRQTHGA